MTPAQAITKLAHARVGSVLQQKWRLDSLLGIGGTACVYAATHRNGKRAAVKILHPELSTNEGIVVRFLREGYVANKLEHPGAVSVLDDDRAEDGSVYLVMDLLHGHSLERYAKPNGERLPLSRVLRIADEMLDVLAVAHGMRIIHRDLKPANVFLTREGQTRVLDFGIARLLESTGDALATQTGAAIGTPAFMPPEQARGQWDAVDGRTDLWAVGATMFALIAGDRPRRSQSVQEELFQAMTAALPSLAERAPSAPPAVVALVDRAVSFDMAARWPDARAMQAAVRAAFDAAVHADRDPITSPSQPRADTAPVLVDVHAPANGPISVGEAQLTTGRPMVHPSYALPPSSPAMSPSRVAMFVSAAAFATVLAVGSIATVAHLARSHRAAGARSEGVEGASTPTRAASPAVTAGDAHDAVAEAPSARAPAAQAPVASSAPAPAPSAVASAAPAGSASKDAPKDGANERATAPGGAPDASKPPAGARPRARPAPTINPLDQRF